MQIIQAGGIVIGNNETETGKESSTLEEVEMGKHHIIKKGALNKGW